MHLVTLVLPLLAATLSGASLGCSVGVSSEPPVVVATAPTGTLTVRWLVTGTASPPACSVYGASTLELVVYDTGGNEVAHANEPCSSFGLSLELPEGTYSAEATLIDSAGNSRTTTKPLQAIEVVAGTDLAIDLDFPASSFL